MTQLWRRLHKKNWQTQSIWVRVCNGSSCNDNPDILLGKHVVKRSLTSYTQPHDVFRTRGRRLENPLAEFMESFHKRFQTFLSSGKNWGINIRPWTWFFSPRHFEWSWNVDFELKPRCWENDSGIHRCNRFRMRILLKKTVTFRSLRNFYSVLSKLTN